MWCEMLCAGAKNMHASARNMHASVSISSARAAKSNRICDISDFVASHAIEADGPRLVRHRERRSVTHATPSASRADVGSGTITIRENVADPPALVVLSPTKKRFGVSYGSSVPVKAL